MEHNVKQRSKEWFDLRKSVCLTASKFGDALGIGMGRPYDFFISMVTEDAEEDEDLEVEESSNTKHGLTMEEIIGEAYQLLTGNQIRDTGFWSPQDKDLAEMIGASPDAVILDPQDSRKDIGLCEFKAPIYRMYRPENSVKGIPRAYMAQIQGQLAVTGHKWCHFMAMCKNTKEVMLKRVEFAPEYWDHVMELLKQFCYVLQDSQLRKELGQDPLDFEAVKKLQKWPMQRDFMPGELSIPVEDLLEQDSRGRYYGPAQRWMSFDFLIGQPYSLPPSLRCYGNTLISDVDQQICRKKQRVS
ncbi:hypothetical protein FSP39_012465 [Pinctada imbricata]|uniref:YqaJ viral recombinase domain-containing protein n=1 Tax=Pinctada imbricata TaxID=66713 RepID=A0AA89BVJ0_PINIB|nr:hypothetical protein FSP39_012465 [Pinctada imbricata]